MTKFNIHEKYGEESIKNLIKFTKEIKKFKNKIDPIIKELEKKGVFD